METENYQNLNHGTVRIRKCHIKAVLVDIL